MSSVWVGVSAVASRQSGSHPARLTSILFSSSVTFLTDGGGPLRFEVSEENLDKKIDNNNHFNLN